MKKQFKMNRLVILGNGFDLAHGLPTSYCDFINNYWLKIFVKINDGKSCEDDFFEFDFKFKNYSRPKALKDLSEINNYIDLKEFVRQYEYMSNSSHEREWNESLNNCKISVKNIFFEGLCIKNSIQNWVDVENEYYKLLKECLREKDNSRVILLNKEFEQVKNQLELYLNENVNNKFKIDLNSVKEFVDIFESDVIKGLELLRFYQELPKKESELFRKEFQQRKRELSAEEKKGFIEEITFNYHFLSFNYTFTAQEYIQNLGINPLNLNEIHGSLSDKKNPINFGFGDEMDKFYQEIEEKDDNEYLRNIKSFQYLHTQNYKRLLDLIDSEKFQVYIMGHSCGLSDRILLNTIFEHENCKSIKIFYHQKDDDTNNYTEITQNISRHFNKKKLMREKIVNRILCQSLPQTKLIPK